MTTAGRTAHKIETPRCLQVFWEDRLAHATVAGQPVTVTYRDAANRPGVKQVNITFPDHSRLILFGTYTNLCGNGRVVRFDNLLTKEELG